jgi:hypothetical protein
VNQVEFITLNKKGITDFAGERNKLLRKAKAEWVFFVDRDEKVSNALRREILAAVQNKDKYNGFYVVRQIIFLGKFIGRDQVLRLARKGAGKWRRAVHETWDIKGKVGTLRNCLSHRTAEGLREYLAKINYFSTLHARENLKEGKHSNIFKIICYPKVKFLWNFLSGRGFVFSLIQSFHSFLGWAKMYEIQNR